MGYLAAPGNSPLGLGCGNDGIRASSPLRDREHFSPGTKSPILSSRQYPLVPEHGYAGTYEGTILMVFKNLRAPTWHQG